MGQIAKKTKPAPLKSPKNSKKTQVKVKFDAGFGNELFIRGEGCKTLSWDKGTKLKNVKEDEWVFETGAKLSDCRFKILINDQIFEEGENHVLKEGQKNLCVPHFQW